MTDGIAPTAPAPAPTTNGVKPGATARGTVTPAPAKNSLANGTATKAGLPGSSSVTPTPRAQNGQFAPRDGATGVEPQETETTETKAEAYRLKAKLNVYGEEREVDLDEDGIKKQLQRAYYLEKKEAEARKATAALQRLEEIGKTEEGALKVLQALGHDPQALAAKMMAMHAQREMMTDEQRAIMERDEKIAAYEQEKAQRLEAEKKAAFDAAVTKAKAHQTALFEKALEVAGLPKTHETILMMAETYRAGGGIRAQYTPEELARETERRDLERGQRLGKGRTGTALLKFLGDDVVKEVMRAKLAEYETRTTTTQQPARSVTTSTDNKPSEILSMSEVKRRLRGG